MTNFPSQLNRFFQRTLVGVLFGSMISGISAVKSAEAAPAPQSEAPSNSTLLAQEAVVIERGSSGDLVSELQRRLTTLGYYDGPVSGFFGELTEAAVIQFQEDQGLVGDGIVGASTASALRETDAADPGNLLQTGSQGPRVIQLQERLTTLGYYDGPISGFFGELTEAAVIQFQRDRGLTADGIVGDTTESALNELAQSPAAAEQVRTPDPTDGLLERSEIGEAVTELQRRLTALGFYDGPIDGNYGPRTEAAVSRFQSENELVTDGIAGPATLAAIDRATSTNTAEVPSAPTVQVANRPSREAVARPPARPEAAPSEAVPIQPAAPVVPTETAIVLPVRVELSPDDIRDIQARLQDRGFYDGPIDGVLNDATRRAIARAQQAYEV
ncbi:MAG: peptidoglycan-binding protein, partial [Elainellaceae cyanobacterium]